MGHIVTMARHDFEHGGRHYRKGDRLDAPLAEAAKLAKQGKVRFVSPGYRWPHTTAPDAQSEPVIGTAPEEPLVESASVSDAPPVVEEPPPQTEPEPAEPVKEPEAEPEEEEVDSPTTEPPKPKRRYRRKDMVAEE